MSCGGTIGYGSCGETYRRRGYAYACSDGSDTYITCGGEIHYGGRYPVSYFSSCGGSGGCGFSHDDYSTGCGSGSCGG